MQYDTKPFSDKASDAFNKTVRETVRIAYFTKSVDHIPIEFRMSDPLLQKSLQTGVVLSNKVPITFIKLHKERTKFMITVTLLEKFTCNYYIAIIKIESAIFLSWVHSVLPKDPFYVFIIILDRRFI